MAEGRRGAEGQEMRAQLQIEASEIQKGENVRSEVPEVGGPRSRGD